MRGAILAGLVLFGLSNLNFEMPEQVPEPVVEVVEERPRITSELRYQAFVLEFQEGLARVLVNKTGVEPEEALQIAKAAYEESLAQDVDVFRTLGFIVAESWANAEAISKVGARGLMQIMPATGQYIAAAYEEPWEGKRSLHDIDLNIRYGVWYYRDLLDTFEGDEHAAIAAYNWGPEHIAYRIRNQTALPRVYPGKVLEAEEEVRKEFLNGNQDLVWRSYSRAECIASTGADLAESACGSHIDGLRRIVSAGPSLP